MFRNDKIQNCIALIFQPFIGIPRYFEKLKIGTVKQRLQEQFPITWIVVNSFCEPYEIKFRRAELLYKEFELLVL